MEETVNTMDHYQRIYRKTMDNFICFFAQWELTYKCNLRCRHCYAIGEENREEFSFEKANLYIENTTSATITTIPKILMGIFLFFSF